jgi:putative transcriptional regulator
VVSVVEAISPGRAVGGSLIPQSDGGHYNNGDVESLQGQLLVASPGLLDPNFRRTVVLVTEHNDEGAAGLVLNRPSPAPVVDLVPQVLVLGEFLDPDDAAVPLFGALGFPSLDDPGDVAAHTTRRRVFAGYAGWGAGQLEDELGRDDWIVESSSPDDPFTEAPEELWADVLRRKGGIYELVARIPEDPSVN